jgi:NADP-dependent 3-hydroxy acid dehydrogenase YdfG
MDTRNDTRVVAITGAAGAIAGALAERFAAAGWRLALIDLERNRGRLNERYPDAHCEGADLTDAASTAAAVSRIEGALGGIDALLNIAGGFGMQSAVEATTADLDFQLDLNVKTLFHTTTAALPGMLERGGGFVMGVAAAAAVSGRARMPTYGAAKAAVVGYLNAVRAEVEARGVEVTILYPMGTVDTAGNRASMPDADPNAWIDRQALADTVLFLAERGPRGRVRELHLFP